MDLRGRNWGTGMGAIQFMHKIEISRGVAFPRAYSISRCNVVYSLQAKQYVPILEASLVLVLSLR